MNGEPRALLHVFAQRHVLQSLVLLNVRCSVGTLTSEVGPSHRFGRCPFPHNFKRSLAKLPSSLPSFVARPHQTLPKNQRSSMGCTASAERPDRLRRRPFRPRAAGRAGTEVSSGLERINPLELDAPTPAPIAGPLDYRRRGKDAPSRTAPRSAADSAVTLRTGPQADRTSASASVHTALSDARREFDRSAEVNPEAYMAVLLQMPSRRVKRASVSGESALPAAKTDPSENASIAGSDPRSAIVELNTSQAALSFDEVQRGNSLQPHTATLRDGTMTFGFLSSTRMGLNPSDATTASFVDVA